ncbi:FKBP-type peptidyl-prolyl cis-trans isomerase [Gordonia shandongensis]|uniref:FKBP-type peptidyl-prolyl cis-trans isomerase n=1 Tax=Gordonia shandongensis TaxID=376351 RepID=UPI0003FBE2F7|nr:FKBP-type peptidyl-prolyl cis-trans isomerase [Gordonia shandongensis]
MKHRAKFLVPALAAASAAVVALTGCSGDAPSDEADASTPSVVNGITAVVDPDPTDVYSGRCPTEDAASTTRPQWTVRGATGKAALAPATSTHGPLISITTPFSVYETQVKTFSKGDGPRVTDESTTSVCYTAVNGRTDDTFDSTYYKGQPLALEASQVVPGFRRAIVGQTVGSTVGVVVAPADGYPDGTEDGRIKPGDSLVFVLRILAATESPGF